MEKNSTKNINPQVTNNIPQPLNEPKQTTSPVKPAPPVKQTPAPIPPEPVTPNKGTIGLLLILLFLLLVIGGGYFAYTNGNLEKLIPTSPTQTNTPIVELTPTPTVDPIAGWETYTTSTYQVRYPSDLIVKKDEGSMLNISKWGPTQTEGTELFDGFSINFMPREIPNSNLDSYVQAKLDEIKNQDVSEVTKGPDVISVNNYSGLAYEVHGLGDWKEIVLQTADGIIFMEISIMVADPGNLGFSSTVDQILSTFEFN